MSLATGLGLHAPCPNVGTALGAPDAIRNAVACFLSPMWHRPKNKWVTRIKVRGQGWPLPMPAWQKHCQRTPGGAKGDYSWAWAYGHCRPLITGEPDDITNLSSLEQVPKRRLALSSFQTQEGLKRPLRQNSVPTLRGELGTVAAVLYAQPLEILPKPVSPWPVPQGLLNKGLTPSTLLNPLKQL